CNQDTYELTMKPYPQCLYGTANAKKIIVLWGDSHGEHMLHYLHQFGKKHNVAVLQRTRYQCPPLVGRLPVFAVNQRSNSERCLRFNEAVMRDLEILKDRVAGVFISVRWPYYQNNGFVSHPDSPINEDVENGDPQHTISLKIGVSNTVA